MYDDQSICNKSKDCRIDSKELFIWEKKNLSYHRYTDNCNHQKYAMNKHNAEFDISSLQDTYTVCMYCININKIVEYMK